MIVSIIRLLVLMILILSTNVYRGPLLAMFLNCCHWTHNSSCSSTWPIVIPIFQRALERTLPTLPITGVLSCLISVKYCRSSCCQKDPPPSLNPLQGGFHVDYSCSHTALVLLEVILQCICKCGKKAYVAFLDVRKTFDTKDLLVNLHQKGITGHTPCH